MSDAPKKNNMNVLVVITALADTEKLDRLFRKAGPLLEYRFRGEGTASNETMDVLGLTNRDRAITVLILPKQAVYRVMRAVSDELGLYKPGNGIAFCVPLSGISSKALNRLEGQFCEEISHQLENEVNHMFESYMYSLVVAAIDQGYSEEVMETARACGANGGTVIHARRLGLEEKMKFWGISMQNEKDIVTIIIPKEQRLELMQAIGEKHGMQTEAHGLIFSMPVEGIAGIGQQPII